MYQFETRMHKNVIRTEKPHQYMIHGSRLQDNPVPVSDMSNALVTFSNPETGQSFSMDEKTLAKGVLIPGSPRTGKSNAIKLMLKQLLKGRKTNDIFVIFDTKGDYFEAFKPYLNPSDYTVIGMGDQYRKITGCWNIFGEIMPRGNDGKLVYTPDSDVSALDISDQLFEGMNSTTQPIFTAMSTQIFTGVIIYFMRTYWRTNQRMLTNKNLIDFILSASNETFRKIFSFDYMHDQHGVLNYISGTGPQTQGVNSYLNSVIRKMFIGPFCESDPNREISMKQLIHGNTSKKIVFLEYDLMYGQAAAPVEGVLIDRAFIESLGGRTEKRHVYFILDELKLLPKISHLTDAINFGAGLGVRVICGIQNIEGIQGVYGEYEAGSILSSFQNLFTFKLTGHISRQAAAERSGKNLAEYTYRNGGTYLHHQKEGYCVEEEDIAALKCGQAVVTLSGHKPFLFQFQEFKA